MAAKLLFIQNTESAHEDLENSLLAEGINLKKTENVASAIRLIDDNGFKPSAILVDIPEISETQMEMLESIDDSLGVLDWVFITYDLSDELSDRLDQVCYRTIKNPCSNQRVIATVKKAIRSTLVQRRLAEYASGNLKKCSFDTIVGKSKVVQEYRLGLQQLSQVPMTALMIKGETGSGKGHAAGILHNHGLRKDYSLIEMNCAAMPQDLVESQLFGHEAGAFTGAKGRHRGLLEQADNGTLFLDEIGEMPLDVQAKLLKAIEEQSFRRVGGEHEVEVDVQVFAASNRDLQQMVIDGEFREDLYHRLNVFEITVPSLREYKSDLLELVPAIIAEFNHQSGKKVGVVPDTAWAQMMNYDWPGNIRELKNALERAVLLSTGEELNASWLNLNNTLLENKLDDGQEQACSRNDNNLNQITESIEDSQTDKQTVSFKIDGQLSLEEMDRKIIQTALALQENNISKAAELLGTTRETLRYRINKYELDTD